MRLIDADEFKSFILSLPKTKNGYSETYDEYSIECFIDSQPTAYDVDNVLEKLKEKSGGDSCGGIGHILLEDAVYIVKEGLIRQYHD